MRSMHRITAVLVLIASLLPATIRASAQDADYQDFATAEFQHVWERTDYPVLQRETTRTWIWGPGAITGLLDEAYVEAEGGERQVQYSDKSRMEMPWDGADPESPWAITQGLLAYELMSGRLQLGDVTFEQLQPARIPVAGDADDADGPSYAEMRSVMELAARPNGLGISQVLHRDGSITDDDRLLDYGVTDEYYLDETSHNIASVFWEFMNSTGTIYEDDKLAQANVFEDPFYAVGFPTTEAYWSWVKVDEVEQDVLTQCFERRCLTYAPDNPEGWQVESGNVGLHYYTWRYHEIPAPEPVVLEIDLEPQAAINYLVTFDLEFLGIDPDDSGERALLAIVNIDPTDDPIVLTRGHVEGLITLITIVADEVELLDLDSLTPIQLGILAEFHVETAIDLLTIELEDEDYRAYLVTLLVQLRTEGAIGLADLAPAAAESISDFLAWAFGIHLDVVDLETLNRHTVVATITGENGDAVSAANLVHFVVSDEGANVVAQGTVRIDEAGQAAFTYLASGPGVDTITATVVDTTAQETATKTWTPLPTDYPDQLLVDATLTLAPEVDENPVGTEHTVTADLLDAGLPVVDAFISFTVVHDGSAVFGEGYTDNQGQVTFTYIGESPGEDEISSTLMYMDEVGELHILEALATKIWVE